MQMKLVKKCSKLIRFVDAFLIDQGFTIHGKTSFIVGWSDAFCSLIARL